MRRVSRRRALAATITDAASPTADARSSCFCGVHRCDSVLPQWQPAVLTRSVSTPTALALAAALNPVLYHLWVHLYTGNANFVLATTIVHSLALTAGVVNIVGGACA